MLQGPEYCHSEMKANLDKAIATGTLPATSPLWLGMYLYNKCRNQPLFFEQDRIGQNLQPIKLLKFETLHAGDECGEEHNNRLHTSSTDREKTDPRIPNKTMAFLRDTGLNEIPQLINVIRGNLSIVGPRPTVPCFLEEAKLLFPDTYKQWSETAATIKPGLVGVSPLKTRRMPVSQFNQMAEADIAYFHSANLWKDLLIISQAMIAVARR